MQNLRIITGVLIWLSSAAALVRLVQGELRSGTEQTSVIQVTQDIGKWVTEQKTVFSASSQNMVSLAVGDPVLLRTGDGRYLQVGVVQDNFNDAADYFLTNRATVAVYNSALNEFPQGFRLEYYATPESLDWVATTMIPPARQQQIVELMAADWKKHQDHILENLKPILQESLERAIAAIEAELPATIERHRNDFSRLGDRYRAEIMQKQMLPLVKDHILPIVQSEVQPLLNDVGRNLWNRVSVWSFTWRYFYDVSPLPERNAVRQEFDRFLEQEAIPELQSRTPDFIRVTERIIARLSRDPKVSETIRRNLKTISSDPELHQIVWTIIRESILQNQQLHESLEAYLNSEQTSQAIQQTSLQFEPTARAVGDLIIGSREAGITAEFARILRVQILLKDRHWLVLVPDDASDTITDIRIVPGTESMMFPLTFEGTAQSPLSRIR